MSKFKAAVLGSPVEHSLSPVLHNSGYAAAHLDDWSFERIECTAEDLPRIVGESDESYRGFAVTMPGKFAALKFADEVTERAELIGAANTLVRTGSGWRADNTDCEGILFALGELLDDSATLNSAVVIGAGGTARPAIWALAQLGVRHLVIINRSDRSDELAGLLNHFNIEYEFVNYEADLEKITLNTDVIISTVPSAGIEEHVSVLGHAPTFDVIYNPWPTPLVIRAASNGHRSVGGHVLLAAQSFSQFEQITGVPAPRDQMRQALIDHLG